MGTIIIGAIILCAIALAVRSIWKDRKNGKSIHCSGCCGHCSRCHEKG